MKDSSTTFLAQGLYPDLIDRYRLMAIIARSLRRSSSTLKDKTEVELAHRASVSQGTISNLENLEKAKASPKRRISREELLKVLFWGLDLSEASADALVWLYDGDRLDHDERRRFSREGNLDAPLPSPVSSYLEVLRQTQTRLLAPKKPSQDTTFIMAGPTGEEDAEALLLRMEQDPGQRLLVTAFPTLLAWPADLPIPQKQSEKCLELIRRRAEVFRKNLSEFGERSIHCRGCIHQYIRRESKAGNGKVDGIPWEQRKMHIQSLLEYLKDNPKYQIGLSAITPDQEYILKMGFGGLLRGRAHQPHPSPESEGLESSSERHPGWGPKFIFSKDMGVRIALLNEFETRWNELDEEGKNQKEIRRLFEKAIKK